MQLQLDSYANSAAIWADVKTIMDNSLTAIGNGTSPLNTDLGKLLKWSEVEEGNLNPYAEDDWYKELQKSTGLAALFTGAIVDALTSEDLKDASEYYSTYGSGANNSAVTWTEQPKTEPPKTEPPKTEPPKKNNYSTYGTTPKTRTVTAAPVVVDSGGHSDLLTGGLQNEKMLVMKAYASGGLADFTGPAWLDGTKTHPEMVLSAKDTANFVVLKDVLAEILEGASSISRPKQDKGGDNYYDVEINVENISDDYDVEKMAEKIKSMIYDDAVYRNVNSINNIR
jgi:hypothetical protein